jgi:hypothetical protein
MNETQRDTQKITENHLINSYLSFPKKKKEKSIVLCTRTFDKKSIGSSFPTKFLL